MQELRVPRKNVFDALSGLEHLPEPPSRKALERARQIAHVIIEDKSPLPFVFPTEIGGVQFEWHGGRRELDVEILPEGEHLAYLTLVDGKCQNQGQITRDTEREILALLNWIVSTR